MSHVDMLGAMCRLIVRSNDLSAVGICESGAWVAKFPDSAELILPTDPEVHVVVDGELEVETFQDVLEMVHLALKQRKRLRYLEGEVLALDRTEHLLRRREMELNGLVDGAPMAIFILGCDGKIRFVNQFVESLVRRDREDLLGQYAGTAHQVFHVEASVQAVLDTQRPVQIEKIVTVGSEERTFLQNSFPLRGADGEIEAICIVAQDISQRKRSELALAQSERNYREIFNRSTDLIILNSIETGEVVDVNARIESVLGYTTDEWRAQTKWMSSAVEMGEGIDISLNLVHEAAENPVSLEWPLRHKDGSVRWFELQLFKTTISGQPLVMAVGRDIQKRKLEQQQRVVLEENVRRSQKFDALGRLAAGVAQEFNNLLAVILRYSELLKRELQDSLLRDDVHEIQEAASRAAHLTRKLLMLGQRGVTRPVNLHMNEAIRGIGELLQKALGGDVHLALELNEIPEVTIDPALFDQVLVNLTVHSREAMGAKGRFEIFTCVVDTPEGIRLRDTTRAVMVRITDSGPSILPEALDHVFEPYFTRLGEEPDDAQGLGLALVHSIVEHAGGAVRVVGCEVGAQFELYFPVAEPRESTSDSAVATILVVEDEPSVLASVRRILEARGHTIMTASNAEDALKIIQKHKIDLMLTDVVMPGISGPELAAQVRREHSDFAVLFMSGYPDNVIGPDWAQDTATDLLLKPFTAKSLIRAIEGRLASVI